MVLATAPRAQSTQPLECVFRCPRSNAWRAPLPSAGVMGGPDWPEQHTQRPKSWRALIRTCTWRWHKVVPRGEFCTCPSGVASAPPLSRISL